MPKKTEKRLTLQNISTVSCLTQTQFYCLFKNYDCISN